MPSENDNSSDKELLLQIAAGDETAFTTLVDRHWKKIYSVAISFLKSTDLSKDIVQDVFLKVWTKRADLPEIKNFEAWVSVVARNKILNLLEKKGPAYPVGEWLSALPAGEEQSPEKALSLKELRERIHEGIELLPPQQKLIFTLSRMNGLSHEEICDQLGIARSTVKNSLVKALNFLRNHIQAQDNILILIVTAFISRK